MNIVFLNPSFLWALTAVAIPVIIHFFNFRRHKTLYFSNVSILKEIRNETRSKSQLKNWLILLFRILTITALVLAFSKPVIPLTENKTEITKKGKRVAIYIDNSFSSNTESKNGIVLNVAKQKAVKIAESLPPDYEFVLITNDFDPAQENFQNREKIIQNIGKLTFSPSVRKLSEVKQRASFLLKDLSGKYSNNSLYLVSDFQKCSADFDKFVNDSTITVLFIPMINQKTSNLFIDSCWFDTPYRMKDRQEEINVRISNFSGESFTGIPLKLYINDSLKAISNFDIKAGEKVVKKLSFTNFTSGIVHGKLEITDYPVIYDNLLYFSYSIKNSIKILMIDENKPNPFFKSVFEGDEYFELTSFTKMNINFSDFSSQNVIFLNGLKEISSGLRQELMAFIEDGGNLIINPNNESDIQSYNNFLSGFGISFKNIDSTKASVKKIDLNDNLFKEVFDNIDEKAIMPIVFENYNTVHQSSSKALSLLSLENGKDLLISTDAGKGKLYLFTAALNRKTNELVKHPIFVPAVYNMCFFSGKQSDIYYNIGNNNAVSIAKPKGQVEVFHIVSPDKKTDFIPENVPDFSRKSIRLLMHNNIYYAGNYNILSGNQIIEGFSFNYNRLESMLEFFSPDEIKNVIEEKGLSNATIIDSNDELLSTAVKTSGTGTNLWKYFIILALIFIAFEILTIRLSK